MNIFNPSAFDAEPDEFLSGQSRSGLDKKFCQAGIFSEPFYQRRKRELPHCQETNKQQSQLNPEMK